MICMSISVPATCHPIAGRYKVDGRTRLAGKMNEKTSPTRAVRLKRSMGRFDILSKRLYMPVAPNEAPTQAARMGNMLKGRKSSGTVKMALAIAANSKFAAVEPIPARKPASIKGPNGNCLYPFIEVNPFCISSFSRFIQESYPGDRIGMLPGAILREVPRF
jgi:hypothetical protein